MRRGAGCGAGGHCFWEGRLGGALGHRCMLPHPVSACAAATRRVLPRPCSCPAPHAPPAGGSQAVCGGPGHAGQEAGHRQVCDAQRAAGVGHPGAGGALGTFFLQRAVGEQHLAAPQQQQRQRQQRRQPRSKATACTGAGRRARMRQPAERSTLQQPMPSTAAACTPQVRLKAQALAQFVGAQHGAQRTYALLTFANKLISQCEVQVGPRRGCMVCVF